MAVISFGLRLRLRLRLLLARHRRVVVAALLALAVASALSSLRPPSPSTVPILVARSDLPAGHRLIPGDLLTVAWAASAAPRGAVARPAGQVLAAPVRRGEPVTDVRLRSSRSPGTSEAAPGRSGPSLKGRVVVTVRLTDPASALLAAPGDHIQVIAGPPSDPLTDVVPGAGPPAPQDPSPASGRAKEQSSGSARIIVEDALVLEAPTVPPHAPHAPHAPDTPDSPDSPDTPDTAPSSDDGLLGALGASGGRATAGDRPETQVHGEGSLPAGVLAVAVHPADALDLAAVAGVRALTVARRLAADDT